MTPVYTILDGGTLDICHNCHEPAARHLGMTLHLFRSLAAMFPDYGQTAVMVEDARRPRPHGGCRMGAK